MGTPFATQKAFAIAEKSLDKKLTGADAVIIVSGYENTAFMIKTSSLPMIKNDESVEFTGIHGVKTSEEGKIQTYNELPVTFMENQSLFIKEVVEQIITEDKNDELEIEFWVGRDITNMKLWGKLQYASIHNGDYPEADTEAGTAPMNLSFTLKGHYFPPTKEKKSNLKGKLGLK